MTYVVARSKKIVTIFVAVTEVCISYIVISSWFCQDFFIGTTNNIDWLILLFLGNVHYNIMIKTKLLWKSGVMERCYSWTFLFLRKYSLKLVILRIQSLIWFHIRFNIFRFTHLVPCDTVFSHAKVKGILNFNSSFIFPFVRAPRHLFIIYCGLSNHSCGEK